MPPEINPVLLKPLALKEYLCHVVVIVCGAEDFVSRVKSESPTVTPESVPLARIQMENVHVWPLILPLTCCSRWAQSPNVPLPFTKTSAPAEPLGASTAFASIVLAPSLTQAALSNCSE